MTFAAKTKAEVIEALNSCSYLEYVPSGNGKGHHCLQDVLIWLSKGKHAEQLAH